MDAVLGLELPIAVVVVDGGGARLVEVEENDGLLVERADGVPVELTDLVAVYGLPDLAAA